MKTFAFVTGVLFASVPLAALVAGCSGGSGGVLSPVPNPTPTATATQAPLTVSNFTLGNGQRAILSTRANGTQITGTIQILAPIATRIVTNRANVLSFNIAVGTYAISGTLTPPRGYLYTGNFGSLGAFSINGLLPTPSLTGTYTLSVNGQTEDGILPTLGTAFPTATPVATVAPTSAPNTGRRFRGTISGASGFNGSSSPIDLPLSGSSASGQFITPGFSDGASGRQVQFTLVVPSEGSVVGTYPVVARLSSGRQATAFYNELLNNWEGTAGNIVVDSESNGVLTFRFVGVNMTFGRRFGSTSSQGTFTLNGSGNARSSCVNVTDCER